MINDYKSDLTGIGNRSLTNIDESLTGEALCLRPYSALLGFAFLCTPVRNRFRMLYSILCKHVNI